MRVPIVYFSGQSISGCYCAKKGIITAFFWFISQKIARPLILYHQKPPLFEVYIKGKLFEIIALFCLL